MTDSDPDGDPGTSDTETTFYQYDLFGNLLRVDLPDGRAIEYDVDGAGRRVGRWELDASGVEASFRGWIYRDLLRPIAEVDASGNVVARYVYGDGKGTRQNASRELLKRLGLSEDGSVPYAGSNLPELIEILDAGEVAAVLLPVGDQVGSVMLVANVATGEITQRIEYDEFGARMSDNLPQFQPFGFAGGLYDWDTMLVRFGLRDYDSESGRWLARDPIRFAGALNLYAYGRKDPVNGRDPGGTQLATEECAPGHKRTITYGINECRDMCGNDRWSGEYWCEWVCPVEKRVIICELEEEDESPSSGTLYDDGDGVDVYNFCDFGEAERDEQVFSLDDLD